MLLRLLTTFCAVGALTGLVAIAAATTADAKGGGWAKFQVPIKSRCAVEFVPDPLFAKHPAAASTPNSKGHTRGGTPGRSSVMIQTLVCKYFD